MNIPSFEELKEVTNSRYELCILASKRARKIVDGGEALIDTDMKKPVSIAIEEIMDRQILFNEPMTDKEYEEKIAIERAELEAKLQETQVLPTNDIEAE